MENGNIVLKFYSGRDSWKNHFRNGISMLVPLKSKTDTVINDNKVKYYKNEFKKKAFIFTIKQT